MAKDMQMVKRGKNEVCAEDRTGRKEGKRQWLFRNSMCVKVCQDFSGSLLKTDDGKVELHDGGKTLCGCMHRPIPC